MVDQMVRQIDITSGTVIIYIRQPYLQTVGIGKKSAFGINIGYFESGGEMVSHIP